MGPCRNVVIVGGGVSGVAVAMNLLRRGNGDLHVDLVERTPWLGRGIAYRVDTSGAPSERLLAIGAVRRASSWETTSVPDISVHALALATRLVP